MAGSDITLSATAIEKLDGDPPRYSSPVLRYLRRRSTGAVSVAELARAIRERDRQAGTEREVATQLHHATLPKLADSGLVDYDAESNTVHRSGAEWEDVPGEQ